MEALSTLRPAARLTLTELPLLGEGLILGLSVQSDRVSADLPERLAELGFLPGARVRVLARALFGDPIAVRLGSGTFALRRFEADCITVQVLAPPVCGAT
jgi:ferrous iron transport protein A